MKTILLDCDGVLSWFGVAAARACGRLDMEGACPATYHMEADWGLSAVEFWKKIDAMGIAFWTKMLKTPWCEAVWDLCRRYADQVVIVTSPPRAPHAWAGRVEWIQDRFGGPAFRDFILCPAGHKHLLAAPGRLLIDDNEENVDRHIAAGGDALLWPATYNRNREIPSPLTWLERNLQLWSRL